MLLAPYSGLRASQNRPVELVDNAPSCHLRKTHTPGRFAALKAKSSIGLRHCGVTLDKSAKFVISKAAKVTLQTSVKYLLCT